MIAKLKVKFWRWNYIGGERTELLRGISPIEYELTELGLVGSGEFSFKLEGDGDTLSIANVSINMANTQTAFLVGSSHTIGTIEVGDWGILQPFFDPQPAGNIVVAECLVCIEKTELGELTYNDELLLGDVSTYKDFVEEIEGVDYIIPFVGYIDMTLSSHDLHNGVAVFQLVALDNLLTYLDLSELDIPALFDAFDLLTEILDLFPFVEVSRATSPLIGYIPWIVPKGRVELGEVYTDTTLDHFARQPRENAKLIAYKYDGGQVYYFKINAGIFEYFTIGITDLGAYSILSDSVPGTGIMTGGSLGDYSEQFNGVDHCLTEAVNDLGFVNIPYQALSTITTATTEICVLPSDMLNLPSAFAGDSAVRLQIQNNSDGSFSIIMRGWDGSAWTGLFTRGWSLGTWESADYDPTNGMTLLWREGWERWWIISEDGNNLFSYPTPDEGRSTYGSDPLPRTGGGDIKVYSVGIELGSRDDFEVFNTGTPTESQYRKYPNWFTFGGLSYCVVYAKALPGVATSLDIDDPAISSAPPLQKAIRIRINDIPSDMPKNPVYLYDRNRLEIWWYDGRDLKCYDWRMNLKYLYGLGVDFQRVALGRDKDGKLLITITLEQEIIVARHEITNRIFYPEIDFKNRNAKDVLTALAKWGFQAWWIDIRDGATTFNLRNRYSGDDRGEIVETTHTFKAVGDSDFKPNRDFERGLWDKYADMVIVSSDYGELARVGNEGVRNFEYKIPARFYHYTYGRAIGNKIWSILGQRRAKVDVPVYALYTSVYDFFTFYDRLHCLVGHTGDFTNEYRTDMELVEMDFPRELPYDTLFCILESLGVQTTFFQYLEEPDSDCYCLSCLDQFNALMEYLLILLNNPDNGFIAEGYFAIPLTAEISAQVLDFLASVYYTDDVLFNLVTEYVRCLVDRCELGE